MSTAETWYTLFLTSDAPKPLRAASARGGLVIAAGAQIFVVPPGLEAGDGFSLPELGEISLCAAEARAPHRFAVSDGKAVIACERPPGGASAAAVGKRYGAIVGRVPSTERARPTHLAWAAPAGQGQLFARWSSGEVTRTTPREGTDVLEVPPLHACASDASGNLAFVHIADGWIMVYRSRGGTAYQRERYAAPRVGLVSDVHFAVAGDAFAISMAGWGVHVCRGQGEPLLLCPQLSDEGPFDFGGSTAEAPLFGVDATDTLAVVRVRPDGTDRVAKVTSSKPLQGPFFCDLSWDATRDVLVGVSPRAGLLTISRRSAKENNWLSLS